MDPALNKVAGTELNSWRMVSDPLADETVRKIIEGGEEDRVNQVFQHLTRNRSVAINELPDEVRHYFEVSGKAPDWYDPEQTLRGQRVFSLYGPEISTLLLCKALPETYACWRGAEVLHRTGRFAEKDGKLRGFTRRLMETAQFVVDVTTPGGLDEGGHGIVSAQKVRLIHAAIRYFINRAGWDTQTYGEPINQQDMAGTLMAFSVLMLDGLEALGIKLSEEDKQGYYHLWRVTGYYSGVHLDLMPAGYEDANDLGNSILESQMGESEAGRELTKACLDFMRSLIHIPWMKHIPDLMVYHMAGEKVARLQGIDVHEKWLTKEVGTILIKGLDLIKKAESEVHALRSLSSRFNRHLLQGMLNYFNQEKRIQFYIPPDLVDDWKVHADHSSAPN